MDKLQQELEQVRQEKDIYKKQLEDSEHLLRKLGLASKTALEEFNNLKQQYLDEHANRQSLQAKLKQYETRTASATSSSSNVPDKQRIAEIENELAFVRVQLFDAVAEFTRFKNSTDREYNHLAVHLETLKQSFQFENVATQTTAPIQPPTVIKRDPGYSESGENVFNVISEYVKQVDQLQPIDRRTVIEIPGTDKDTALQNIADSLLDTTRRSRLTLDNQFNLFMESQRRSSINGNLTDN